MIIPPPSRPPRRIVLLAGPSGSGKGMLSRRSRLPTVALDEFYRELDEPGLPRRHGIVDWDSPASWDAGAALEALTALAHDGTSEVPVYSISASRRQGTTHLDAGAAPLLLAEGIFAAELIAPLAAAGLLADAMVLRRPASLVFVMRLLRDLRERRKLPHTLLRRGWALAREQRTDIDRWIRAGMRPVGLRSAQRHLLHLTACAEAELSQRTLSPRPSVLRIAAVCFLREASADSSHRTELLCVRKHGTGSWMQVGGKLDPGESAREAALREVEEELGVQLEDRDIEELGQFEAAAANEPGTVVSSSVFLTRAPLPATLEVRAELARHQWIPIDAREMPVGIGRLAPLMVQHILPALRTRLATDGA